MRFKKVKKEKVISSFSFSIAKSYIRNRYSVNTLSKIKSGTITSEIEEVTRFSKPAQFFRPKLSLQFVQDQSPNIIHIYPGPKACKSIRLVQFWNGFI